MQCELLIVFQFLGGRVSVSRCLFSAALQPNAAAERCFLVFNVVSHHLDQFNDKWEEPTGREIQLLAAIITSITHQKREVALAWRPGEEPRTNRRARASPRQTNQDRVC